MHAHTDTHTHTHQQYTHRYISVCMRTCTSPVAAQAMSADASSWFRRYCFDTKQATCMRCVMLSERADRYGHAARQQSHARQTYWPSIHTDANCQATKPSFPHLVIHIRPPCHAFQNPRYHPFFPLQGHACIVHSRVRVSNRGGEMKKMESTPAPRPSHPTLKQAHKSHSLSHTHTTHQSFRPAPVRGAGKCSAAAAAAAAGSRRLRLPFGYLPGQQTRMKGAPAR